MKVLLVQPYNLDYTRETKVPTPAPFALICLASVLRENGHDVYIFDRNLSDRPFEKEIKKIWPDMVGITSFTGPMILDALEAAKVARETTVNAPIVWGGIHPSMLPIQTIEDPYVDIVAVGEGEYTILELADAIEREKPLDGIKGIIYKENGTIHRNPPRQFMRDLDELPMPAWDLIDLRKYSSLHMFTSRGCPHNCAFCYNNEFYRCLWRGRSSDKVIEEISYLKSKYKTRWFVFGDDNFTCNKKRLREICNKLIVEDLDIQWRCESRVDYVNREILGLMKKAGCHVIYFGVESGSQRILDMIDKGITLSKVRDSLNLCSELGIASSAAFLIGLPTETEEDLAMTKRFSMELPLWGITVKIYVPYPGTDLYDLCVSQGLYKPPGSLEEWGRRSGWGDAKINVSKIPSDKLVSTRIEIEEGIKNRNFPYYLLYSMKRLFDGDFTSINVVKGLLGKTLVGDGDD
ncbi:MAG: radical SAM protein [Halobacteriota archaeon]|nr:radical SAM protein [Halobacteriota archaeon]